MSFFIACGCGLDPASESMLLQSGLAAVLATPFWFRSQLANVMRRLLGARQSCEATCETAVTDEDRRA